MRARCIAVALALGACGGTALPPGWSSNCKVVLSGASNGTYGCTPAMTDWSSFYDMSTFSFKIAAPDGTMVDLSVSFRGEPRTGAIGTLESVGAVIEVRTTGDAGPTRYWYATKECCGGPPDYGHF